MRQPASTSSDTLPCLALLQEESLQQQVEAVRHILTEIQSGSNRARSTQLQLDAAQDQLAAANREAEAAKEVHAKVGCLSGVWGVTCHIKCWPLLLCSARCFPCINEQLAG
jgi:hypothetical protein